MANHSFKTPGILRSGFDYQDLIGIEVLLRFYRDPDLFDWVAVEADEPLVGKLDDVVAARKDGSLELLQVKFTPDPTKYFLDWKWLLHREGKGTCLLEKWADALNRVAGLGPVHSAKLRTNRRPDATFIAALNGSFVEFERIPEAFQNRVATALGGSNAAKEFFARFEFSHSEMLIEDLEAQLRGSVVPTDTTPYGWIILRQQVQTWATRKKQPEPDGRIRHRHLTQIITQERSAPIRQDFIVPALYQVPSTLFDESLQARLKTKTSQITVLWGSPGRGKSTYLSHLVNTLRNDDFPAIRHHYFLSLEDNSHDRISFPEITHSLMDQLAERYPEAIRGLERTPNQLRKWIEQCGEHFLKEDKGFFVVIDGLDHVWREQQNTAQMEHLFNYLLPCPANVQLVIGTQKVDSKQLPLRLLQHAKADDWIEVPPMDETAIHAWLQGQYEAKRLLLREQMQRSPETELSHVSQAFFEITAGNPLHLIYSFEALFRRGVALSPDEIRLLPACPDGDIRKYYAALWARLPDEARQVIHLIAATDFHWPEDGLRRCGGALAPVHHLLEPRRTGLIPFHGSITAFAREQTEHAAMFKTALPAVISWLEYEAPIYWRWGWLWTMQAKNGDPANLLQGPNRQWVIDSLAAGWPADQIVQILTAAEREAFAQNDFILTRRLRSLKVRLENGQDFQTNRFGDFEEAAVRSTHNDQRILSMADMLPSASNLETITLLRCLADSDEDEIASECYEELRRKVNVWIYKRDRTDHDFYSLIDDFLEAAVESKEPEASKLMPFMAQFSQSTRIYRSFLRHVVRTRNFDLAADAYAHIPEHGNALWKTATQRACVRIACSEGIDLTARINFCGRITPLLSCWIRLKGMSHELPLDTVELSAAAVRKDYEYGPNPPVERFLHTFFFSALDIALQAQGDSEPVFPGIDRSQLGWLKIITDHMWRAANEIAKDLSSVSYASIFLGLGDLAPLDISRRPSDPDTSQYRALRATIGNIALDLHALKCAISGPSQVTSEEFSIARASTHWLDEVWIEHELRDRRLWIEPQAVKSLVDDLNAYSVSHVTQFSERAERWTDLAQLSVLYGLEGAAIFVKRAADCIIGYGWRKDIWIFDVLSSIEAIHDAAAHDIRPWLHLLLPIVDQITTFTDGDETNHAPEEFIDLVGKAASEWLSALYGHYVFEEEYQLAERTLAASLRQMDFKDPATAALTSTLLERADVEELYSLKTSDHPGVSAHLRRAKMLVGMSAKKTTSRSSRSRDKRNSDVLGRKGRPPDVKKYSPDEFEKLIHRLSSDKLGYMHRDETLVRWLKYWDSQQNGLECLAAIEAIFMADENPHRLEPLLDDAFDISLRLEGRQKAYKWIVRAQIERRGWDYWWDNSGRVERRLKLAAQHYPDKWLDFIKDTSSQTRFWERRRGGFTVGSRRLVQYLLFVGQTQLAVSITDAMVSQTLEELRDQPIPPASWLS